MIPTVHVRQLLNKRYIVVDNNNFLVLNNIAYQPH